MNAGALIFPLVGPTITRLADIIRALKEPMGKKGIDQIRVELTEALENVNTVLQQHEAFAEAMAREMNYLRARVEYLELPFYKRWFTPKPTLPATGNSLAKL
ncbi:MAG TPA: hypothetical protein VGL56_19315 [Fimbriimonadaceae bacterium]|jgi:hypothetical protein